MDADYPPWGSFFHAETQHLHTANRAVLLVSCADKLHNARAIVSDLLTHGPAMFDRFNAGMEGTLWYYGRLAEAFEQYLPSPLSRDLTLAVAEMTRLSDPTA